MNTKVKVLLSVIAMGFVMVGCGGGSSSGGSTPVAPAPPLYSTIQDLEFKTLNMKEIWYHDNNTVFYTTMKFTNNYRYGSNGTPILIDNTSSSYFVKGCSLAPDGGVGPNGVELTYLCAGVFGSGAIAGWALSINNGGIISGNFHFSSIGDTYAVAAGLIDPSGAHAKVEGGVSNTVATNRDASGIVIASVDGGGDISEAVVSNVDDDINKEKSYADTTSDTAQATTMQEASPEIRQGLNELYEVLLQSQSEK